MTTTSWKRQRETHVSSHVYGLVGPTWLIENHPSTNLHVQLVNDWQVISKEFSKLGFFFNLANDVWSKREHAHTWKDNAHTWKDNLTSGKKARTNRKKPTQVERWCVPKVRTPISQRWELPSLTYRWGNWPFSVQTFGWYRTIWYPHREPFVIALSKK